MSKKSQKKPKIKSRKKPSSSASPASAPVPAPAPISTSPNSGLVSTGQQRVLDHLSAAFRDTLASYSFDTTVQAVKAALFARDFAVAFGEEENVSAYAARWSPTRALCYASVLERIAHHIDGCVVDSCENSDADDSGTENENEHSSGRERLRVVSIGGGPSELAALATFLAASPDASGAADLTLLDSGPWANVVSRVYKSVTAPLELSAYASAQVKAANAPMINSDRLAVSFKQVDVLTLDAPVLTELLGSTPTLITVCFTLNELYTSSGVGQTTAFLLKITAAATPGTLLLVVDSPGNYSEATVGTKSNTYPMAWLLDHALCKGDKSIAAKWEKLETEDSVWFRLAKGLQYPIPLEDMRYQLHLYVAKG